MPDTEGPPRRPGPEVDRGRRKLLQTGLGLAGTALALDVIAAAKPAAAAVAAATDFRNGGKPDTADPQVGAHEVTQHTSQTEPFHPTAIQGQTAAPVEGAVAHQTTGAPNIGGFSPQDGLHWLEQHWQGVVEVGVPVGVVATLVAVVRSRLAANRAMASSFQYALSLLESADTESKAAAAVELLYLLSNPRSEKYHQRIFSIAVAHFRQRNVGNAAERETSADFKFAPVLVFAASAIRDKLQRKGAPAAGPREEHLNASNIHLDNLSLRDADLSYLILKHATFTGAVLGTADLSHADLAGADLSHTTLNGTDLSHTVLFGANLTGARARNANLSHAHLGNTNLQNADLSYANLAEVELREGARLEGANIYRAAGMTVEARNRYLALGAIERDWGI